MAWVEAKAALAEGKKLEADLRKKVLAECFPESQTGEPVSGVSTLELGNDYRLKADFKLSYKLSNLDDVSKVLDVIANTFDEGDFIAKKLVKYEPKLSLADYKKLPDNIRSVFDEVLTVTQAAPTVTFVEPKVDKWTPTN